jgi:hypothetical protein
MTPIGSIESENRISREPVCEKSQRTAARHHQKNLGRP